VRQRRRAINSIVGAGNRNAGFIRQLCNRCVLLPDKSGVPMVMSKCASSYEIAGTGERILR